MRMRGEKHGHQPDKCFMLQSVTPRTVVSHVNRKDKADNGPWTQDGELPVEQSMCTRPSSLVVFIFLAVCSEVVGETRVLVLEKQEAFTPRMLSAACSVCSIFLFRDGRAMIEGVTADVVCALPSRW
jgi:hypothetical protein